MIEERLPSKVCGRALGSGAAGQVSVNSWQGEQEWSLSKHASKGLSPEYSIPVGVSQCVFGGQIGATACVWGVMQPE